MVHEYPIKLKFEGKPAGEIKVQLQFIEDKKKMERHNQGLIMEKRTYQNKEAAI